jgi:prolyl oligopeptidase
MKKILSALIGILFLASGFTQFRYPKTEKRDSSATYFGTKVEDPYKWLEDDMSEETAAWVKAQNEFTFEYLNKISYRAKIKERLSELWDYEKKGAPFVEGGRTFLYKNDGLQNQYVLCQIIDGKEEVFLDPNTFAEDGTTSLAATSFSKDGSKFAYAISEGGSDWQ